MIWRQRTLSLGIRPRGVHLITADILGTPVGIDGIRVGLMHLFLLHTSAALAVHESSDPEVIKDMERFLDRLIPEGPGLYRHTAEGPDDMPAHVASVIVGVELTLPIRSGSVLLGTWQGISLIERRRDGPPREVVITVHGDDGA